MWKPFEPWQLSQLTHLAAEDPDKFESVLNTVWIQYPDLLLSLAVGAASAGELTFEEAAQFLDRPVSEVQEMVKIRRMSAGGAFVPNSAVVVYESGAAARLAGGKIAVWEVVRAYRRLGSMDRLKDAFPSLAPSELSAAIAYAERNPEEIQEQIEKYEDLLEKRRALYPYAK